MTIIPKPEGLATWISTLLAELGIKTRTEDDASSVGFWALAYFQGAVSVGFKQGNFPNSLIKKNHEDITGVPECLRNKEHEHCLELLEKSGDFISFLWHPGIPCRFPPRRWRCPLFPWWAHLSQLLGRCHRLIKHLLVTLPHRHIFLDFQGITPWVDSRRRVSSEH